MKNFAVRYISHRGMEIINGKIYLDETKPFYNWRLATKRFETYGEAQEYADGVSQSRHPHVVANTEK